jgi:hypothetical protein
LLPWKVHSDAEKEGEDGEEAMERNRDSELWRNRERRRRERKAGGGELERRWMEIGGRNCRGRNARGIDEGVVA